MEDYDRPARLLPDSLSIGSPEFEHGNGADSGGLAYPATWVASRLHGKDAVAVSAGQFADGHCTPTSPVTPLNVGPGLHGKLADTYNKSTAKQSEFELPTTRYGGVTLTQNQMEEKDRTVHTGIKENGSYHRWVWAQYYFTYYVVCICGDRSSLVYHQWQPDHFQGTIADCNPNVPKGRKRAVGHLGFKQPRYDAGPNNAWAVAIRSNSLPFERDNGTRQENDVRLGFSLGSLPHGISGGSISLEDLTTHGSITSVTCTNRKGCRRGDVRVVWGVHDDPVHAARVMSSCVPRSQGPA